MLSCRPSTKPVSGLELLRNTAKRRAYSHKVRAFPFAVSKEKAIADLSWNTAAFTGEKVPGTFLRHLLPSLNVDALQPIRAVPVYLPTWVIDAEAEVTVWSKKQESDDHFVKDTAQVQFAHSDMPGFAYGPLSNFSFMNPRLLDAETVRWSEDLRKHEGEDVICVPFSLSPFKLPDAARSLSMADASVADVLRFEPSSVKETVLAGYPVLLPGYLAQYKVENAFHGKVETVSAFIEAGVPRGRAVVEVLPAVRDWFNMFNVPVGDVFVRGPNAEFVYEFTNARSLIGNHISLKHRHLVEQWLDRAVVRGQAIEKYRDRFFGTSESAAARNVDWSDIRIRPFDLEERHANLSWLKSGANLFLLRTMLQVYNSKRESLSQTADGTSLVPSDSEVEWVKTQIATTEKEREESKPAWIHEYEIQQRLLAPHDSPATPEARLAQEDAPDGANRSAESDTKPAEGYTPVAEQRPAQQDGPTEGYGPAEGVRLSEGHKPAKGERPAEGERPADGERPAEGTKPTEGDKP